MNGRNTAYKYASARLTLLALCFLTGMIAGQAFAFRTPQAVGEELRAYFSACRRAGTVSVTPSMVICAAVSYVRYPLLAFVLGYIPAGAALLCGAAGIFGFFLSFSAGCMTAAFGWRGIVLAAAATGIRCLITLPCFFLLAVPSMENALMFTRTPDGRRKYSRMPPQKIRQREQLQILRVKLCSAALCAGIGLEVFFAPHLIRLALEWIFR